MLAVDLTRPEFGLPVVRVVVPGLEGLDDVLWTAPLVALGMRALAEQAEDAQPHGDHGDEEETVLGSDLGPYAPELLAHVAVAAVRADAGDDEVTHPRQAGERRDHPFGGDLANVAVRVIRHEEVAGGIDRDSARAVEPRRSARSIGASVRAGQSRKSADSKSTPRQPASVGGVLAGI